MGIQLHCQIIDKLLTAEAVNVVDVESRELGQSVRGDLQLRGDKLILIDEAEHVGIFFILHQLAAGQCWEVLRLAINGGSNEKLAGWTVGGAYDDPGHGARLCHTGEVVLLAVVGLAKLKEIIQTQELTDPLRSAATGNEAVLCIVYEKELVHIGGLGQVMGAGLDAWRWVALLIVHHWASHVAAKFGQVARQLENPVDSSHIDLSSFVVDGQMCKPPIRRGKSFEGWGLASREG